MGFQLAGPVGGDARILALGQAYHQATDWPSQRPPPMTHLGSGPLYRGLLPSVQ
jgi:hypothetical protein